MLKLIIVFPSDALRSGVEFVLDYLNNSQFFFYFAD